MSIRLGGAKQGGPGARPPAVVVGGIVGLTLVIAVAGLWLIFGREKVSAAPMSGEAQKLADKGETRRAQSRSEAQRLKQQEIGEGYEFDSEGQLIGVPADTSDLPQTRRMFTATAAASPRAVPS